MMGCFIVLDESIMTTILSNWLTSESWIVTSIHYPGSTSSGAMIKDKFAAGKGTKGSIIPDIIAEKGQYRLIVETRPKFNPLLIKKLADVVYNDAYLESLKKALRIQGEIDRSKIIIGKAIHKSSKIPKKYDQPNNVVIFKIDDKGLDVITGIELFQ